MGHRILHFTLLLFITAFIFAPLFVNAAGLVPCGQRDLGEPDCQTCHFFVMAQGVIDFIVLKFTPPVAVLLMAISGILMYTSGGSETRLKWAKDILWGVIIGLLIIYGAWMIINSTLLMVSDAFTPQPPGFPWPWNEIRCSL